MGNGTMKIAIASDHGGFELKETVCALLVARGVDVEDLGCHDKTSVDYPDYAKLVTDDVVSGQSELGILCCTTGIGMSIAANKVKGIRAALVHHEDEASLTRRHNNANVLVLPGKHTSDQQAYDRIQDFISTEFEGGRHARRVDKMEVQGETCC